VKNRIIALDYLRVLGALLVVAVHADNITISPSNFLGGMSGGLPLGQYFWTYRRATFRHDQRRTYFPLIKNY
jgi:peptidoglycan/LPS O-acetylase OafA/YrhL